MFFIFRAWQERVHISNQLRLEKMAKAKEHELNIKNLEFFTNISHEFRTPLSLIIGPLDSLIDSAPKNIHNQLKVIQRNSQRLLALTNNLLDLRKLDEGGMQLNISKVDIEKSTDAIVEYFIVHINKRDINLTIDYPKTETVFYFDNEKYTTILFNLLSNAIKYTPENGSICISVKHQPIKKQLEISIMNTGIGILPSELPNIFDKFYQAGSGRNKRQFGTGIGLALSKGLVELLGGEIWASSIPDQETIFTFTIPLNLDDSVLEKEYNDELQIPISEIYIDNYENEDIQQELTLHDEDRPLVLIVEDNSDLRLFLKKELEQHYAIALAANGEEGLLKAKEAIPDLIISDIVMPLMSGMELCKAIKVDVRTSHIPFVMLTAKTTTMEQIEGLDIGADAYITKPFDLKLLQTQVSNLILSRKDLYARFSQDVYIMARKQSGNELDQTFLQKTIDFILNNITDSKLSIESLSTYHNMSHRNFYRKIKALTGNTVVEFIKIVRLKQALKLMETQQHSLSEVAYLTGFTSPSYFSKNFREFYGKPPSDYLRS
jgi:DNA-binding response OmpR family regulator/nitrogen-specific signal transduction histidine kinase